MWYNMHRMKKRNAPYLQKTRIQRIKEQIEQTFERVGSNTVSVCVKISARERKILGKHFIISTEPFGYYKFIKNNENSQ